MFQHEKQLFHPVAVEGPNPQYAALLQEQLGGANGELKAAMQYLSQSFRISDAQIKDLFLDIAAEELGHMEMVAQTIHLLNGHDVDAAARAVIDATEFAGTFGHGLGHSVGLVCHDGMQAGQGSNDVFQTGNIITMEPGIYLKGKFGVRIEDMVLLSEEGTQNLTDFPKELMIL